MTVSNESEVMYDRMLGFAMVSEIGGGFVISRCFHYNIKDKL